MPKPRQRPPVASPAHAHDIEYDVDSAIPRVVVPGVSGRRNEGLSPRRARETMDLRALIADVVLEYTSLKRRDQIAKGVHPDEAIEIVEEYDPVVAMALIGVSTYSDELALAAHAKVASFTRPTLKSVEVIGDADKIEDAKKRNDAAGQFLSMIDNLALERRKAHDASVRDHGVQLAQPMVNVTPPKAKMNGNGSAH